MRRWFPWLLVGGLLVALVGIPPSVAQIFVTGGGGGAVDTAANYLWSGVHTFVDTIVLGGGGGTATLTSGTLRGPTAVGTDISPPPLVIEGSTGTGTGNAGALVFRMAAQGTASGTTPHTLVGRKAIGATRLLPEGTAAVIANVTLDPNTSHASMGNYTVEVATAAGDVQVEIGVIFCRANNKGGAITNNQCGKNNGDTDANHQALTAGTLAVVFAISATNPAQISVNANTSLTPLPGYPRITMEWLNGTQQGFAPQGG